ncbi:Kelch domain-containing protein 4, partial [Durusdinium trenchii]
DGDGNELEAEEELAAASGTSSYSNGASLVIRQAPRHEAASTNPFAREEEALEEEALEEEGLEGEGLEALDVAPTSRGGLRGWLSRMVRWDRRQRETDYVAMRDESTEEEQLGEQEDWAHDTELGEAHALLDAEVVEEEEMPRGHGFAADKDKRSCCWCSRLCVFAGCFVVGIVTVYLAWIGIRSYEILRHCERHSCARLEFISAPDLCGDTFEFAKGDIGLPFDVLAKFDLPGSPSSVFKAHLSDVQVSVTMEDEPGIVFRTSSFEPAFFRNGRSVGTEFSLGKSSMQLKGAQALFDQTTGPERLAKLSWRVLNQLDVRATVHVDLRVETSLLLVPLSTKVSNKFTFSCTGEGVEHACQVQGSSSTAEQSTPSRGEDSSSDGKIQAALLAFDLEAVHFDEVTDTRRMVHPVSQVRVSVNEDYPALRTSIGGLPTINVFASQARIFPTRANIHNESQGVFQVAQASVDAFAPNETFVVGVDALVQVSTEEILQPMDGPLRTLQKLAQQYLAKDGSSSYLFIDFGSADPARSCALLDETLAHMDPVRFEVAPLQDSSVDGPPVHEIYGAGSQGNQASSIGVLRSVQLESVKSTEPSPLRHEEAHGKLTSLLELSAKITGQVPKVRVGITTNATKWRAAELATAVVGGISVDAHHDGLIKLDLGVSRPAELWDAIRDADFQVMDAQILVNGSKSTDLSLVSLVLKDVSYLVGPSSNIQPGSDADSMRNHVATQVKSIPNEAHASWDISLARLGPSLSFAMRLNPAFMHGAPIRMFNSRYNVEMTMDVKHFQVGPGTTNKIQGTLRWITEDGGDGLYSLIDDVRKQLGSTSLKLEKASCVDVELQALHRLGPRGSGGGGGGGGGGASDSTYAWRLDVGLRKMGMPPDTDGPLDVGCITSDSSPCAPLARNGLAVEVSPVDLSLSSPETQVVITSFPPIGILVGDDGYMLLDDEEEGALIPGSEATLRSRLRIQLNSSATIASLVRRDQELASFVRGDEELNLLSGFVGRFARLAEASKVSRKDVRQDGARSFLMERVVVDVVSKVDTVSVELGAQPKETTDDSLPHIFFHLPPSAGSIDVGQLGSAHWSALEMTNKGLLHAFKGRFAVAEARNLKAFQQAMARLVDGESVRCHVHLDETLSMQQSGLDLDLDVNLTVVTSQSRAPDAYELEVVGGRDDSGATVETLQVPCVFPNLCPAVPVDVNGKAFTKVFDLLFSLDVGEQGAFRFFELHLPAIGARLDCCSKSKFVSFHVAPVDAIVDMSAAHRIEVPLEAKLENVQLIKSALQTVMDSVLPIDFHAHVEQDPSSLVSRLFADAAIVWQILPTSPDGLPVPAPKEDQWWFPLASVGAWSLTSTNASAAEFSVNMVLHNPSPINFRLRDMEADVGLLTKGSSTALQFGVGQVLERSGDLVLPGNATSRVKAGLSLSQFPGVETSRCSPDARSDPTTSGNCVFSTLLEQMISKMETRVLVSTSFVNPTGQRVRVNIEAMFFEGQTGASVQPYAPAPRYAKDLPSAANSSAVDEFVSVFQTVNIDFLSTVWETLINEGVYLALEVALHNPFAFPVVVDDFRMDLSYDDPAGEYLWYLPKSYPPRFNFSVVRNLAAYDLDLVLPPDSYKSTPRQTVHLEKDKVENACRLYNAAEKVQSLCASLPSGLIKVGIGAFKWTQHFKLLNVTAVGSNACLFKPACTPRFDPALLASDWSTTGTAKVDRGRHAVVLTEGDSDEISSAWLPQRMPVGDGFDARFDFVLRDTATLGGGDGFAFVVRGRGGPTAVGSRCLNTPCNGYPGIKGPSFAVVLYRSAKGNIELHFLIDGKSSPELGFATSPLLAKVADNTPHALRVFYSRNDRKIYVFLSQQRHGAPDVEVWQGTASVWEPAPIDTGQCSAGSATARPEACVDMDAIADSDNGTAWIGFTASTGFTMTSHQEIRNFELATIKVDMEASFLVEDGLVVGQVGQPCNITVDLRDSCGAAIRRAVSSHALGISFASVEGHIAFPGHTVLPHRTGLVTVSFVPDVAGDFVVSGQLAPGKPVSLGTISIRNQIGNPELGAERVASRMGKKKGGSKGGDKAKAKEEKRRKQEAKAQKKAGKKAKKRGGDGGAESDEDLEAILQELRQKDADRTAVTVEVAPQPSPRANFSLVPLEGSNSSELLLFGGELFDGNSSDCYNDLFRLNLEKLEWKKISSPNSPDPRNAHQAVTVRDAVYVFGGEFSRGYQFQHYRDLWKLDLQQNAWTCIEQKTGPSPRSGHRMLLWKHFLVLFGGFYETSRGVKFYDDLYFFDLREEKWHQGLVTSKTAQKPSARSGFQFVAHASGNVIFMYGGYSRVAVTNTSERGRNLDDMWALHLTPPTKAGNPPTFQWESVSNKGAVPSRRSGASSCVHRNRMILFGGVTDAESANDVEGTFHNTLHAFDMDRRKWFALRMKAKSAGSGKRRRRDKVGSSSVATWDTQREQDFAELESSGEDDEEEGEDEEADAYCDEDGVGLDDNAFYVIIDGKITKVEVDSDDDGDVDEGLKDGSATDANPNSKQQTEETAAQPEEAEPHGQGAKCTSAQVEEATAQSEGDDGAVGSVLDPKEVEGSPVEVAVTEETGEQGEACSTEQPTQAVNQEAITKEAPKSSPPGRIGAGLGMLGSKLFVFGGTAEQGDRQITFDDLWTIDLNKMDEWSCLIEGDWQSLKWVGEDEQGEDDDDEEEEEDIELDSDNGGSDDEEEEDDEEDELKGMSDKDRAARVKELQSKLQLGDDTRTPLPKEPLRDFFRRTAQVWMREALSENQDGRLSGKELRRKGFKKAQQRFDDLLPVLQELDQLEEDQRFFEELQQLEKERLRDKLRAKAKKRKAHMDKVSKKEKNKAAAAAAAAKLSAEEEEEA